MTEQEAREAHIKMWDWLIKNPKKTKEDWPGWQLNGGEYPRQYSSCFACTVAANLYLCTHNEKPNGYAKCSFCPLNLSPEDQCSSVNSVYIRWAHGISKRKMAIQLRDAWPEVPNG